MDEQRAQEIFLSIIVPAYKVPEEYFRKCIESIIRQNGCDWEVIIIDDGDRYGVGKIADEYASRDYRVRVIHKKNEGVSAARNDGIKVAKGKWITFVDGDDWIEPNLCNDILNCNQDSNVIMFGYKLEYVNGTIECGFPKIVEGKINDKIVKQLILCPLLEDGKEYSAGFVCCKAYKSEFIKSKKCYFKNNMVLCEDMMYFFNILNICDDVTFIPKRLYHYRQRAGSARSVYRSDMKDKIELVWKEFENLFSDEVTYELRSAILNFRIFLYMFMYTHDMNNLGVHFFSLNERNKLIDFGNMLFPNDCMYKKIGNQKNRLKLYLIQHHFFTVLYGLVKLNSKKKNKLLRYN